MIDEHRVPSGFSIGSRPRTTGEQPAIVGGQNQTIAIIQTAGAIGKRAIRLGARDDSLTEIAAGRGAVGLEYPAGAIAIWQAAGAQRTGRRSSNIDA